MAGGRAVKKAAKDDDDSDYELSAGAGSVFRECRAQGSRVLARPETINVSQIEPGLQVLGVVQVWDAGVMGTGPGSARLSQSGSGSAVMVKFSGRGR